MKLTVEQALQHGVAAHKEGKLQEAERLYRSILQSEPAHPDANHNLGVLAISLNEAETALKLFKTALEANPMIEQFWLSYIDALIKDKQFNNARDTLEQAKKQGVNANRLNSIEVQLLSKTQSLNTTNVSPPQELIDSLLGHYQNRRFSDAEKISIEITQDFPKYQFAWKILGAILRAKGKKSEAVDANQIAVKLSPQDFEAHNNLGITLKELGRFDEAVASYKQAIALKPDLAKVHYNLGITLKELGRFNEAVASFNKSIRLKPDYFEAYNNLGVALKELGRLDEAEANYNQAIAIKPDLAEAYRNLGIIFQELGRLDEAEASYKQAIKMTPDHAQTQYNLGITLQELGRLDEAEASYKLAIKLKPEFVEAYNNLGIILKELNRLDEALASYTKAIEFKSNFYEAYVNFAIIVKNIRFSSLKSELYSPLLKILTKGNFARPSDLAQSILSLLKHDIQIKDLLLKKNIFMSINEVIYNIQVLNKHQLLHHLMRVCPLPDIQFENFFVKMRSCILSNLEKIHESPELINFLSTLSLHCFVNEYVYAVSEEEILLVDELEDMITKKLNQSEQPKKIKILCLATYRPLHQYDWCQKLEVLDNLKDIKRRLIIEPHEEKMMVKDIPKFEEITDNISCKVRKQYEDNPYPRWVKLYIPIKTESISKVCNKLNLHLHCESIKNVTAPSILIAGCGTGQHAIETASLFSNCQVTAVDLSLSSLSYAKRKTIELGITNLEYLNADILKLDKLDQEFNIIESVGVLHHIDKPMNGWKVLTNLLKTGGLMKIGLYSKLARQNIDEVRKEIKLQKIGISEVEMRQFRKLLSKSRNTNHQLLTKPIDFYNLSMLRDLIFNFQEHCFTIPQIKNCLDELGLKFCGFVNEDIISIFREYFGNKSDIYDLELWNQFEEINPKTFFEMYQFWCQKL